MTYTVDKRNILLKDLAEVPEGFTWDFKYSTSLERDFNLNLSFEGTHVLSVPIGLFDSHNDIRQKSINLRDNLQRAEAFEGLADQARELVAYIAKIKTKKENPLGSKFHPGVDFVPFDQLDKDPEGVVG